MRAPLLATLGLLCAAVPASASASTVAVRTERSAGTIGIPAERYRQVVDGVPVIGAERVVARGTGIVLDTTRARLSRPRPARLSRRRAIRLARRSTQGGSRTGRATASLALDPRRSRLVWRVRIRDAAGVPVVEVRVDARSGRIVVAQALAQSDSAQAYVFDPNPPSERGSDDGLLGRLSGLLTGLRRPVVLENLDPGGCLRGRWVRVTHDGADVCTRGLDFRSAVEDDRFTGAMAYFHITRAHQQLERLGFGAVHDRPVTVRLAATDEDNAYYMPGSDEILLGTGGVDAAQDGEVIVHEYTHAIADELSPALLDDSAGAISEGFADYVASSLSARFAPSPRYDACYAEWDASPTYECLRRMDTGMAVGEARTRCGGEIHCAGQVWSGLLWDLRRRTGPDIADRLGFQAVALMPAGVGFTLAGLALVAADRQLYGGVHETLIDELLARRGMLDRDKLDDDPAFASKLSVPATAKGAVTRAEDRHDYYAVKLRRGHRLAVRLHWRHGAFAVRLTGSEGVRIARGGAAATLPGRSIRSARVLIDVRSLAGHGTYTLRLRDSRIAR